MKSRPSSIDMFDWSPHKSAKENEDSVGLKKNWALIGEIDIESSSSYCDEVVHQPKLTLHQNVRRHRCISEDSDFSDTSRESQEEYEDAMFDLKPNSMDSSCDSQSSETLDDEVSFISETSKQVSRQKRRRDDSSHDMSNVEVGILSDSADFKSRKRRRVAGRNKALCAADFNDIFSQIGC